MKKQNLREERNVGLVKVLDGEGGLIAQFQVNKNLGKVKPYTLYAIGEISKLVTDTDLIEKKYQRRKELTDYANTVAKLAYPNVEGIHAEYSIPKKPTDRSHPTILGGAYFFG